MVLIYSPAVFVMGLLAGFAVNVAATRLAAGRSMLGPLRCTRAPHTVTLMQTLPLVGYISQGGRCSTCGKRLSLSYPLVELSTALLFLGLYLLEDWGLHFAFYAVYVLFLMLVLIIDWKHRDIYLTVIGAGCLFALLGSILLPDITLWGALMGAVVAGGFFLLAYIMAKIIFPRIEEPLGAGDILLALMMGLMLGFPNVVGALLVGPLIAGAAALLLLLSRKSKLGDFMPYGVALCAAAILFLVYPAPFADALHLSTLTQMIADIFPH